MGTDPKYKMDDIVGVAALVLLFFGMAITVFLATRSDSPLGNQQVPDPDVYSTPNGNFPKESSYLERKDPP